MIRESPLPVLAKSGKAHEVTHGAKRRRDIGLLNWGTAVESERARGHEVQRRRQRPHGRNQQIVFT